MISTKFREALRDAELPQYKIAWQAGIEPTVLSALLIGAKRFHDNDERIIACRVECSASQRQSASRRRPE